MEIKKEGALKYTKIERIEMLKEFVKTKNTDLYDYDKMAAMCSAYFLYVIPGNNEKAFRDDLNFINIMFGSIVVKFNLSLDELLPMMVGPVILKHFDEEYFNSQIKKYGF